MAKKPTVDWDAIASEYIEARSDNVRPKLEDLANKYGVSIAAIRKRCSREQWIEKSRMFVQRLSQEIREKKIDFISDSLAISHVDFDSDCLNTAREILQQIRLAFATIKEAQQDSDGDGVKQLKSSEILNYANAGAVAQRMGRTALGADVLSDQELLEAVMKRGYVPIDPRQNQSSDASENGESDRKTESSNAFADILTEVES
jgi:hypothetical protein